MRRRNTSRVEGETRAHDLVSEWAGMNSARQGIQLQSPTQKQSSMPASAFFQPSGGEWWHSYGFFQAQFPATPEGYHAQFASVQPDLSPGNSQSGDPDRVATSAVRC